MYKSLLILIISSLVLFVTSASADEPVSSAPVVAAPDSVQEEMLMSIDDAAVGLASCDLFKARDMCCGMWCGAKGTSKEWDAAKAISRCASGYGCDWNDSPATAKFHCNDKC